MSNIQQSLSSGEPGTTGRELFEGSTSAGPGEKAQSFGTGYKTGTEAGDVENHGAHSADLGSGPHNPFDKVKHSGSGTNPGQDLTGVAGSGTGTGAHHTSSSSHQSVGDKISNAVDRNTSSSTPHHSTSTSTSTTGLSGQHAGTGAGATMHGSSGTGISSGHHDQSLGDKAKAAVGVSSGSAASHSHGTHEHAAHQDSTGHLMAKGSDPYMHQHGDSHGVTGGNSGSGTGGLTGAPTNIGSARGGAVFPEGDSQNRTAVGVGSGLGAGAATGAAVGHHTKTGDHGATNESASLQGNVNKASQHGLTNQFDHSDDKLLQGQRARADVPQGDVNLDSANPANVAKDKASQQEGKGGLVDKIKNAVGM